MAKVFVSYSRKDIEFAKHLTSELKKGELDFWIDWEGIPPTVDWWKEIEKGIEEADIFLFLISPDSARSKICGQEIDVAVRNAKRVIPLVVRDVNADDAPKQLGHINWIFFRENDDFGAALQLLLTAIHTDYGWVQTHRRLQVKALEWERKNKDASLLLRGSDLGDAEQQLVHNSSKDPHPTDLQRKYVFASRKSADRQRRLFTLVSVIAAIVLAGLALFGFNQAGVARTERDNAQHAQGTSDANKAEAQTQAAAAQTAQGVAVNNASTAAAAEATARQSADSEATARVEAENALIRGQSVSGPRAEALASLSRKVGDRSSSLAVLLAIEAYRVTANAATTQRLLEIVQQDIVVKPPFSSRGETYVVAFNLEGDQLVSGHNNGGDLKLWLVTSPSEPVTTLSGHNGDVYALAFSPDGTRLASGAFDRQVIVWNIQSAPKRERILDGYNRVFTLAFSPDGKWLATSGDDKRITVWDMSTGRQKAQLSGHRESVFSLAFSPDGTLLVSGGKDSRLIFWNMETLQQVEVRTTHRNFIYSVAFSPDGKTLVSSDEDGRIIIWDANTHQPIETLTASTTKRVSTVDFSPDGKWLVSGSYDGQVILWDAVTHEKMAALPIASALEVYTVRFSPDSTLLAVGDKSGMISLWNMQSSHWLERACALAGRNLDETEWKQYFPGETYRITCQ